MSGETGTVNSNASIWLIGHEESGLTCSNLPSRRDVLKVYFYHHQAVGETVRDSARHVAELTILFWEKGGISTKSAKRATDNLIKLHSKWITLKKEITRQSDISKSRREKFRDELDELFDIAHDKALEMIETAVVRDFLIAQREFGRRLSMIQVQKVLSSESKAQKRSIAPRKTQSRVLSKEHYSATGSYTVDALTDNTESSSDDDELYKPRSTKAYPSTSAKVPTMEKKRTKVDILTPSVTSALDRAKMSDRMSVYVLAATAQSLGHDLDDVNISRGSIHRARELNRKLVASEVKTKFVTKTLESNNSHPLVVHWDGKLLPDITGKAVFDRLPVVVSGGGSEQLLGVPKLASGTGKMQAASVVQLLQEWELTDSVQAMCFDTTASNTGHKSGACVFVEQMLDRHLLYLACRHHIIELLLAAAFQESMMVASSGPNIPLFKRFQDTWQTLDTTNYQTAASDEIVTDILGDDTADIVSFCVQHLTKSLPRDDYREFLELTITFLGEIPPAGIRFKVPGAFHHARWMAKALYALKIWMFRAQFKLTAREVTGLREMCIFIAIAYIKAWFTAPIAISAPRNDVYLLKRLKKMEEQATAVSKVSKKAMEKFSSHLWYLSEELVGLAFFDPEVSAESKRNMVRALNDREGMDDPPKRADIDLNLCDKIEIEDFVTRNTTVLFENLGIPMRFLEEDPDTWHLHDDFKFGVQILTHLKVVNDSAERGVSLITQYNRLITKNEEQKQYLLQVVQEHRHEFPGCTKEQLRDKAAK